MDDKRRTLLCSALALPFLGIRPAFSQQYPAKPIKVIVPTSPGTSTDLLARFFTEQLTKRLKVPVVVENKGGAGGLLGYIEVARAKPDGYTLILSGLPLYLLPMDPSREAPFDTLKDFTPIATIAQTPLAIVVQAESPYRNLTDLIDAMRHKPNQLTYSSQGVGSTAHLCGALLEDMSKTKGRHVPYKQSSLAITDVVGGYINFTCQGSAGVLPLVQSGRLRILAVTSSKRWESVPDVPTAAEAGLPGFDVEPGITFMAPARVPMPIVQLLSEAIMDVAQTQEYKTLLAKNAISHKLVDYKTLANAMPAELERWKRVHALTLEP